jgi:hypothetical protein
MVARVLGLQLTVTVNQSSTITLTSCFTQNPTDVCFATAMTNTVYTLVGATTNVTVTNLPSKLMPQ